MLVAILPVFPLSFVRKAYGHGSGESCRSPERRQKQPLQRGHLHTGRSGRQLPLLHHRAQRRDASASRTAASDRIANYFKPQKIIPAQIKLVDIAGIVKGASEGEGLGNKFLSHIREVDAIVQVVRCLPDPDVIHVCRKVDPVSIWRSSTPS